MLLTQFACGLDGAKKGAEYRLHRLAMQGKAPLGDLVQCVLPRPLVMSHASLLVGFHTQVPHLRCFHLSRLQASEHLRGGVHAIHTYCFHGMVIAWRQLVCKWVTRGIPTTQWLI